jgi:hypothetical protein
VKQVPLEVVTQAPDGDEAVTEKTPAGGGDVVERQMVKPGRVTLPSEYQVIVLPAATATFTGPVVPLYARPLTVSLSK